MAAAKPPVRLRSIVVLPVPCRWSPMTPHRTPLDSDVAAIQGIGSVPRILDAVARLTGMRFAAIARVTDQRWIACAVHDDLDFGLAPGGELAVETTICNEIRQHRQPVAFGNATQDPLYAQHHTPLHYGLESYISVPIFRRSGEFFGTLCAVDSRPAELAEPAIVQSLQLFAEMIGLQLELSDELRAAQARLRDADFRARLLTAAEQNIRDSYQPIVTSLYLLRTSPTLGAEDRKLVDELEASSRQVTELLRQQFDIALGHIEQHLADGDAFENPPVA
jgi:hypothetical protein